MGAEAPALVENSIGIVVPVTGLESGPVQSSVMNVKDYAWLKLQIRFVGAGNATDIGFTAEESDDQAIWSRLTKEFTPGAATPINPTLTTSVSIIWTQLLDVRGLSYVRCDFSAANASAGDTVEVVAGRARGA